MDYEDLIDEEKKAEAETAEGVVLEEDAEIENAAPKSSGKPWKLLLATGLLSGLIGAGSGAYGVYVGLKAQTPDLSSVTASMETKLSTFESRIFDAETQANKALNRKIETAAPVELTDIQTRLEALEKAPAPELDLEAIDLNGVDPEAIAALKAAQADGFEWPDTSKLEARLDTLETKLATSSNAVSAEMTPALEARFEERLADIETRLSAANNQGQLSAKNAKRAAQIEARLTALESRADAPPAVKRVSILAFPKTALLDAVDESTEGGFMKKAFSKHVRVKDDDNPLVLIDEIEADIAAGRLDVAAKKFERLPKPVRDAGRAWYESVKASL